MRRAPGRGPPSSRGPPPGMYGGGGGYYGAGGGGGQGSGNHGAGGVQAAFSNRNQRGEHRPLDVTAGLLAHLDRRLMDSTALGPNARARHSLSPPQSHPAWRRHYTTPRDDAGGHAATAVCAAHVSSSGRQKRIEVRALGWSLEGRRLTTANNEGSVTTWSGSDFSHLNTTQHHLDRATGQGVSIQALAWLRDGTSFVTGDAQGTLHYIDWGGARLDTKDLCPSPGVGVFAIAVAPTSVNHRFASGGDDKAVRIWDWGLAREERALEGHGHRVNGLDWHPSFALLASASKDNTVKLWDPRTPGGCFATLTGHKAEVTKCAWNPVNGAWLLTASRDQTCQLYDLRNLHQCAVELVGQEKEVTSLAWHPTHERLVATGGSDGSLAFWAIGAAHEHSDENNYYSNGGSLGADDHEFGWAPPSNNSNGMGSSSSSSGIDGFIDGFGSVSGIDSKMCGAPPRCKPQTLIKPEDTDINPMTGQMYVRPLYEMAWHPLGHVLATGSKDQTVKFWARKGAGAELLQGGRKGIGTGGGGGHAESSGSSSSGGGGGGGNEVTAAAAGSAGGGGTKVVALETSTSSQRLVAGASPLGPVLGSPEGTRDSSEVTGKADGVATEEEVEESGADDISHDQEPAHSNKRRRA